LALLIPPSFGKGLTAFQRWCNLPRAVRNHPGQAAAVLALLALIDFGVYVAASGVLGWHYRRAGEEALERGDYRRARDCFETCLRYSSRNGQVHYWLARTYRNLGKFDRAHEQLEACERCLREEGPRQGRPQCKAPGSAWGPKRNCR
jgi:tetratricopeptide (TPR) repeat protein